jgi:hypothetical protein
MAMAVSLVRALRKLQEHWSLWSSRAREDRILRERIGGRRVLVLGSGGSARELPPVPSDMLIFSCNAGPLGLPPAPGGKRSVDLYICNVYIVRNQPVVMGEALAGTRAGLFLTRWPRFFREHTPLEFDALLWDRSTGGFPSLSRRLFGRKLATAFGRRVENGSPSTGAALVFHALFYGAASVHLMGIDLDANPYADGRAGNSNFENRHGRYDRAALRHAQARFGKLSTASATSPLRSLLPFVPLDAPAPATPPQA